MINNVNGYNGASKNTSDANRQVDQSRQINDAQQQKVAQDVKAVKGDRVELSSSAKMMKSAEENIKKMPDVDQDKVDRIKNAIRNGEYTINHESLAAAIKQIESEI